MSGSRQPLALLEAKGAKHLTKREKAERAAAEVRVEVPKQIRPPEYLPQELCGAFKSLGKRLRDAGLFTVLDGDTLARYLLARESWLAVTEEVRQLQLPPVDLEALDAASRIQDRFFKQCQKCAGDMGLTVASRCRLALPEKAAAEENPFERLLRERERRA